MTRLKGGVEKYYKLFVLGDPQITNAISPYYTDASDNPVKKSDLWRFTNQTMADIRQTISNLPSEMPVYGLSMGDDVQYYGGYNAVLERQIRQAMGSTRMILFSVIGNHDQDGKALSGRQVSVPKIIALTVATNIMSVSMTFGFIATKPIIPPDS